jgi:hypothetical protein
MSRLRELESRRRVLIQRCELQRAELAARVGQMKSDPLRRAASEFLGDATPRQGTLKHPLTWVVAAAGLFFLRRPREMLRVLMWARTAVSVASRASVAMRLIGQVRGMRSSRTRGDTRP